MECIPGITNTCPAALTGVASHIFLTLINSLLANQCSLQPEGRYPPNIGPNLGNSDEFDFIVVGSGSAGSVVANRLSENENWNVLLLEAGGYPSAMSEIPGLIFNLQKTEIDWNYTMKSSESFCAGLKDKVCLCPRGKGLGGSSMINIMIYMRGNKKDYDSWADAGNTGWDYDSVVEEFKQFEDVQDDNEHFGKGGDLPLSLLTSNFSLRQYLIDGYKELGFKRYRDDEPLGYMDAYLTIKNGTRAHAGKVFVGKVKDRKNLHVAINAHVTKVLLNKNKKSVEGVEVHIDGKLHKIKVRKEVILSAGAINSPVILMNSGIGPKDHLEELGIDVIQDLKVGENLQDHLAFPIAFSFDNPSLECKSLKEQLNDLYQYFMHREGTFGSVNTANFMSLFEPNEKSKYPSIQNLHASFYSNDQNLQALLEILNLPNEIIKRSLETYHNYTNVIFLCVLLNPKSTGKILLHSKDPLDNPIIYPNFLNDENNEDIETVLSGVLTTLKLLKTKTLKQLKAKLWDFDIPNCRKFESLSNEFWKCVIRNIAATVYHPVGTCKMGPKSDVNAVVDPKLRVHGIKGLRVIDASIMPTITSGNTNGPSIMIGAKGAKSIKEYWMIHHSEL